MGFTPDTDICDSTVIIELDKDATITNGQVEFSLSINGNETYDTVDLDGEEMQASMEFTVGDLEHMGAGEIDAMLSAMCKFNPELMSSRLFCSAPTDTDAIKVLMTRMDELGSQLNGALIELAAIRRAAKMLTVVDPEQDQPSNK